MWDTLVKILCVNIPDGASGKVHGDIMRMFMKVHSVFTKVHSRGAVLRARRLRLPRTPPRGAVCAAGV